MSEQLNERLGEHVNSESYYHELLTLIDEVEKPDLKFKMMLELAAFTTPKVKTVDSKSVERLPDINIQFVCEEPASED